MLTRGFAVAWSADGLLEHDDPDAAEELLAANAALFALPSAGAYLQLARARLRLVQGRPGEAEQELRDCARRIDATGSRGGAVFRWRPPLALALRAQGATDAAREVAAEAVAARAVGRAPSVADRCG